MKPAENQAVPPVGRPLTPLLAIEFLEAGFEVPGGFAQVVDGVGFTVGQGSITGLVGESGSGKSTVVRSIVRLLRHPGRITSGRVVFGGVDLMQIRESEMRHLRGARISFVGQNPFAALNPVLTVGQQFRNLITAHRSLPKSEMDEIALQQLTAVRINDPNRVLRGYAHELSGGMAQRVVIAMAMALQPELIIADEPTTALDVTVQRRILDLMHSLIVGHGRSLLLVTHDVGIVAQYCDHVVVMFGGTVVESGIASQVLLEPRHPYTRRLLESVRGRLNTTVATDELTSELQRAPSGCAYRLRCPHVMDRCLTERPLPRQSGEAQVSCHLYEDEG